MTTAKMEDDVPIESKMVSRSIQSAQTQVEARNFEIRKNVLKYDDVLNRQREVIYGERLRVLEGEDLHEQIRHFISDVVTGYVDSATSEGFVDDWDLDKLWTALRTLYPVSITIEEVEEAAGGHGSITAEMLRDELASDAHHAYDARELALGEEVAREVERRVVLSVLDRKWREHLYEMDYLQEGIGLRAMAQRDPLVEYQREGFLLFEAMNEAIKEESVGYLFNVEVDVAPDVQDDAVLGAVSDGAATDGAVPSIGLSDADVQDLEVQDLEVQDLVDAGPAVGLQAAMAIRAKGLETPAAPARLHYSAPSDDGSVQERDQVNEDTRASRKAADPRGGSKKSKAKSRNKRR
jgi:preprotein translocase subunit SecA